MSQPEHRTHAGTDMTTAYAVDSYLSDSPEATDPWAEECFMNMVDAFVNHSKFIIPHATRHSVEHTDIANLPDIIASLHRDKAITIATHVAEELAPSHTSLLVAFGEFTEMVEVNRTKLRPWLHFHNNSRIKEDHSIHLPGNVQPFVAEFWESELEPKRLTEQIATISSDDLRYVYCVSVNVLFRAAS